MSDDNKNVEVSLSIRAGLNQSFIETGFIGTVWKNRSRRYFKARQEGPWWARTVFCLFHRFGITAWLHPDKTEGDS